MCCLVFKVNFLAGILSKWIFEWFFTRYKYIVQGKEINFIYSLFTGFKNKEKLLKAKIDGSTSTTGGSNAFMM